MRIGLHFPSPSLRLRSISAWLGDKIDGCLISRPTSFSVPFFIAEAEKLKTKFPRLLCSWSWDAFNFSKAERRQTSFSGCLWFFQKQAQSVGICIFLWQCYQKSQCVTIVFMDVDSQGLELSFLKLSWQVWGASGARSSKEAGHTGF